MSRSYRKPIYKDGGHDTKKLHSGRYRTMVRDICKVWILKYKEDPYGEPEFKHPKVVTNAYDFCDWRWWAKDDPKAYRK